MLREPCLRLEGGFFGNEMSLIWNADEAHLNFVSLSVYN